MRNSECRMKRNLKWELRTRLPPPTWNWWSIWTMKARSWFFAKGAMAAREIFISRVHATGFRANSHPGTLELRSIADAGLVGYPNAGKSTLLGKISSAHPKVAPYPFTTLHPVIGIVDFGEFKRAPVADIPGLVEGAHRNVGLGHEFLKHIVRCRVLLFVIDMAGSEGRNPIDDFGQLRKELSLYDPTLADRPWLVAANKMDDPNAEANLRHFKRRFRKAEVLPISAELGEGIEDLKDALHRHLFPAPAASAAESDAV